MNRIKSFVLLLCIGGLLACNQKKDVDPSSQTMEVASISEVQVPKFSDQDFQKFAEEYDEFMNKALLMYENDEFKSNEGKLKQERFQKDAKKYLNKMGVLISTADEKEVAKFQAYILTKQMEMQKRAENLLEK